MTDNEKKIEEIRESNKRGKHGYTADRDIGLLISELDRLKRANDAHLERMNALAEENEQERDAALEEAAKAIDLITQEHRQNAEDNKGHPDFHVYVTRMAASERDAEAIRALKTGG